MAIYGDNKHTDKEPEIPMNLYQLKDEEYEDVGLIRTNAPETVVKELWNKVNGNPDENYTDEEYQYIVQEKGEANGYDPEELTLLLELHNTYEVEREWVTVIKAH